MSYHRVLPRPLPLSNEELASRWAVGPDPLKRASIMTNESVNVGHATRGLADSSSNTQNSPPRPTTGTQAQLKTSSPEVEPPKMDSDKQDRDSNENRKHSAVEAWEGDIPGPICLCQPDPKVPRPRNGMQF